MEAGLFYLSNPLFRMQSYGGQKRLVGTAANQHFFEKLGYSQAGLTEPDGLIYEKRMQITGLYS